MSDFEHSTTEGERIQSILDEMVRVTDGLLSERVSFDVTIEYLHEKVAELDSTDRGRVLIFAILEIIKENWGRRSE